MDLAERQIEKEPVRVLVLDDEEMYRVNLSDFISDEGFLVISAGSGEEALELLETQPVDAVIVDMRLPGIDGNTFIIRAHQIQPGLRFIVHTGSTSYSIPDELHEIGLTEKQVFLKPLEDFTILTDIIREITRNKKTHDT